MFSMSLPFYSVMILVEFTWIFSWTSILYRLPAAAYFIFLQYIMHFSKTQTDVTFTETLDSNRTFHRVDSAF